MKDFFTFTLTALLAIFLIQACGPSEEEVQQQAEAQRQAEQDSLEHVWEAEMEQMRQDSIEQARQDSIARAEEEAEASEREREETAVITYDPDGSFTIQVRSWRSEERAEEHANQWRERGFEHVYIEEFGDESVGDVWFRVRLGNVSTHEMASRLQEKVKNEYDADAWVGSVATGN